MTTIVDGRDARWQAHRATRRRELVESTLWAIRKNGPAVCMDDIAAEAGTSKTVIYRHFGDRTGLYLAVVDSVTQYILGKLAPALNNQPSLNHEANLHQLLHELASAYLGLVERDPNIYRFIANRPQLPAGEDPMNGLSERIGNQVSTVLEGQLRARGADPTPATTWGHGVVGFVRAVANTWLNAADPRPREEIAQEVTDLFAQMLPGTPGGSPTPQPTPDRDSGADRDKGEA